MSYNTVQATLLLSGSFGAPFYLSICLQLRIGDISAQGDMNVDDKVVEARTFVLREG